ncbi:MAG: 3'-5' exonuclease, partial [Planctomycetota bacterium]
VDFDDLIRLPGKLLEEHNDIRAKYRDQFRYLMIDEYQDTNGTQYRFARQLVGPDRNICVVGDDDQSIYGFRGAEVDKILSFERDFPGAKVVKLEENYRSTGPILELANAVISQSVGRYPKELRSNVPGGEPVTWIESPDAEAEVDCIISKFLELRAAERLKYEDIAVLLRSAIQARPFEEKLRLRDIPYTLVGGQSWFDRKEIRDVLAYWRVACNPQDDLSLLRIINVPKRGIGPTTVAKLDELARSRSEPIYMTLAKVAEGDGEFKPKVRAALGEFVKALHTAASRFETKRDYEGAARELLEDVAYDAAIEDLYPDKETAKLRWNAVEQLLESASRWEDKNPNEDFAEFLASLAIDTDRSNDKEKTKGVTLMTLHSAKGLEFPLVFLPGLEEELLPHRRSVQDGDHAIDEERRLLYVGITRARRRLFITTAAKRSLWGKDKRRLPSRFLAELSEMNLFERNDYGAHKPVQEDELKGLLAEYRRRSGIGEDSPTVE